MLSLCNVDIRKLNKVQLFSLTILFLVVGFWALSFDREDAAAHYGGTAQLENTIPGPLPECGPWLRVQPLEVHKETVSLEPVRLNCTGQIPSVPFSMHAHPVPSMLSTNDTKCIESCKASSQNDCDSMCHQLLNYLHCLNNMSTAEHPQLFVVPLDTLAWFRLTTKWDTYLEKLKQFMHSFKTNHDYLRFGGSDHVLVCLSPGCGEVMQSIIDHIPDGKDGRMIWVGKYGELADRREKWPCPDRVLNASKPLLDAVELKPEVRYEGVEQGGILGGVNQLLEEAAKKVTGTSRWECSGESWQIDLGAYNGSRISYLVDKKHKILYCGIPKCGTTQIRLLFKRLTGKNWKETAGGLIHGPKSGLWYYNNQRDYAKLRKVINDPSWLKIAFVRHPAGRFLSGYLNKIVYSKEYWLFGFKKLPKIQQIINALGARGKKKMDEVDHHFRIQSSYCGFRHIRLDFIGTVGNMGDDIKELLESRGLWEEYGASGWGDNGNQSFLEYNVYKNTNHANSKIKKYLKDDMMEDLYTIYKEDFDRFNFSLYGVDEN